MKSKPLSVVVVGHTNAGKTSLLRTLTRDKQFGEVSPRNATTRHVEKTSVTIAGKHVLALYDTPGFEDSIAFHAYLQQFSATPVRKERLAAFLESPEAQGRFEQQAKVIKLLLKEIDALIYVIDTTEEPFRKYECELDVLSMCGIPVLPVLNFVGTKGSHETSWERILKDKHFHVKTSFDAVAPVFGSERLLYSKLGVLLDAHSEALMKIANALDDEAAQRKISALSVLADLLINVAAFRITVDGNEQEPSEQTLSVIQERVRSIEGAASDAVLTIYGFDRSDVQGFDISAISTNKEKDLFNADAIMEAKRRLGIAAIIGSTVGLGIDVALAGVTLGAGAILGGAMAGILADSAKEIWAWAKAKYKGLIDLSIDDATLSVLMDRQLELIEALSSRSHAAKSPTTSTSCESQSYRRWTKIAKLLSKARLHPEWSRIGDAYKEKTERKKLVIKLHAVLLEADQVRQATPLNQHD